MLPVAHTLCVCVCVTAAAAVYLSLAGATETENETQTEAPPKPKSTNTKDILEHGWQLKRQQAVEGRGWASGMAGGMCNVCQNVSNLNKMLRFHALLLLLLELLSWVMIRFVRENRAAINNKTKAHRKKSEARRRLFKQSVTNACNALALSVLARPGILVCLVEAC